MQLRRFLTRLLLSPGRQVSQAELVECMWPDEDAGGGKAPADPAATLRVYASRLRRMLPAEAGPHVDVRGYRLDADPEDVDAQRFGRLVSEASSLLAQDPATAATTLRAALALWRGPALAELRDDGWAVGEAVRLEALQLVAQERLHTARLALGDHAALCGELERLVEAYPLREAFWGQLMLALYRSGRQADALRAYQRLREILGEELGIDPSRELVELEAAVLRQDPSLDLAATAPAGPAGPAPAPAGSPPVPPRPAPAAQVLPVPATSFVGRERERAEVEALLGENRLVTLVGAGGAGKTRLALELAFAGAAGDGAGMPTLLVELAGLRDGDEVVPALASSLGLPARTAGEPLDTLVQALRGERLRLLLDNCEHLVDTCAELATALLRSCPGVRLFATSRERLGVDGEAVYRVPSLAVPAAGEADVVAVAGADAVQLFVARARSQRSSFALDAANAPLVASICRRLDGIPLAIELAAARLGALTLSQIHDRLDERFRLLVSGARARLPRQQTLRALIDWSYDLLGGTDRWALRHLAVFAGGFDLESAEAVLGAVGMAAWEVLDHVTSLVDRSLVAAETGGDSARYRLAETIRQYAAERMQDEEGPEGAAVLRDAHAAAFLELAERGAPQLTTPDQFAWLDRLDLEFDNLRQALGHLLERDDPSEAKRMVAALERFADWRTHERELMVALDSLAARGALDAADALTARVVLTRAKYLSRSEPARARTMLAPVADAAREAGEQGLLAEILNRLAWFSWATGDYAEARGLHDEAVAAGRASGSYLALELALSGGAAGREDRLEALELARREGDAIGSYMVLCNLGAIAADEGDVAAARAYFEEAVPIIAAAHPGGVDPPLLVNLGNTLVLAGEHGEAQPYYARALEAARRHLDKRQVGYGLLGLALCTSAGGDPLRAARLHGAAERQIELAGFVPEEAEGRLLAEDQARLREQLGPGAFEAAHAEGAALSEDGAVDLALGRATPGG